MVERRLIRFLVPYSRTLYFTDKGRERGIAADTVRDFEGYINKKYAKQLHKRPITVIMIATTRDKLLSGVRDGLGDVAAGEEHQPWAHGAAAPFFTSNSRLRTAEGRMPAGRNSIISTSASPNSSIRITSGSISIRPNSARCTGSTV